MESCFLGASEDESEYKIICTSTTANKFAIDVHEVGQVFSLFVLGRVSSLFSGVHHFGAVSCNNDKNY